MNSLPKHVVSATLESPEWNATPLVGDIVEEVTKLKQLPGGDLLVYGSRQLVNTLLDHDLIDDIRIWIYPIVVGEGALLFDHPAAKALELVETKTFDTGVVVLRYQPAGRNAEGPPRRANS
jgi:dihydrofolate reductase